MDRIDVVTSSVTFTDAAKALAALRRRAAEAATPALAASAATLHDALLAFTLDLRDDPPGPCRLLHADGPYSHALVECALEAIAPFVTRASQIICRCDRREVWRWRFTGSSVALDRGSLAFVDGDPAARLVLAVRRSLTPRQLDRLAARIVVILGDFDVHEFSLDAELGAASPHHRRVLGTSRQDAHD